MNENSKQDIIRIVRLIEYEGPRDLVEQQVSSSLHGTRLGMIPRGQAGYEGGVQSAVRITAITLGQFPDVLDIARQTVWPEQLSALQKEIGFLRGQLAAFRKGQFTPPEPQS